MRSKSLIAKYNLWVWLHRYAGLVNAAFLIVAGLSGAILAFNTELEHVFAPQLFAKPQPGKATLDLATLAERIEFAVPHARLRGVAYTNSDQVQAYFTPLTNRQTGRVYDLGFDELYLNPWTGEELGRRRRADLSQGLVNLMPFLYRLHWTLLAGTPGQYILGSVALIWTIDCFIGFYLTLPRSAGPFWRRWKLAWRIQSRRSLFRLNFDLHRATGLWVWPALFVFAWSSVMFNIRPAYEKVMHTFLHYPSPLQVYSAKARFNESPRLNWRAAQSVGAKLMAQQGRQLGFTVGQPLTLAYSPSTGAYSYDVRGSRDLFERAPKGGSTYLLFDGDTGEFRAISQPTGGSLGLTIESWLYALHMARVFGRPYQSFVCFLGGITAALPVTGIYLWWKKRHVRCLARVTQLKMKKEMVTTI